MMCVVLFRICKIRAKNKPFSEKNREEMLFFVRLLNAADFNNEPWVSKSLIWWLLDKLINQHGITCKKKKCPLSDDRDGASLDCYTRMYFDIFNSSSFFLKGFGRISTQPAALIRCSFPVLA